MVARWLLACHDLVTARDRRHGSDAARIYGRESEACAPAYRLADFRLWTYVISWHEQGSVTADLYASSRFRPTVLIPVADLALTPRAEWSVHTLRPGRLARWVPARGYPQSC